MIILMNMLIALLSNEYTKFEASTEIEFSQLTYDDSMESQPNQYYSSIENCPMTLSLGMLPLIPVLMMTHPNKTLNTRLNQLFYLFQVLLPFLVIYYVSCLALLPLVYLKVLYCILNNR